MNHASRTKRFALPSRTGLLVALVLAGCQSGGQSDLITRELRMQEDQIYAMEDYLSQYQQLLCQVRAENAALKRQLAAAEDGDVLPAPPAKKGEQEPKPAEPELIEPDVPPLEETTSDGRGQNRGRGLRRAQPSGRPGSPESDEPLLEVRGQSPDAPVSEPAEFVRIRGEVVANEAGGGPRLAVDVEPLSVTFEPTRFAGAVSLMLLEPKNDGPTHSLARWDYSAADARAVLDETPYHRTMRFHLELPPDVPTDRATEFWVRLTPEEGGKVLGHVRVDLSRPGKFASMVGGVVHGGRDFAGSLNEIAERNHNVATPAFDRGDDDGWTIARPDRPRPIGTGGGESSAGWRAATGPMPVVVESVAPVPPAITRPVVEQAAFVEAVKVPQVSKAPLVRTAPVWTPERGGKPSGVAKTPSEGRRAAAGPARPAWSPLR